MSTTTTQAAMTENPFPGGILPNDDMEIDGTDAIWVLLTAYFVFTMQSGFALVEAGSVTLKSQANAYYKVLVGILTAGTIYWLIGYAFGFGQKLNETNGFVGVGSFALDITADYNITGSVFVNYVYQFAFACVAAAILSGSVAERAKTTPYFINAALFIITYSIVSHWLWANEGWLHIIGGVDASGSGVVHLCGGTAAAVSCLILGPRRGRFDTTAEKPVMSSPSYIGLGTFLIWWGWLGFNSGATLGMADNKWKNAARGATTTLVASATSGCVAVILSVIFNKGKKYDLVDMTKGILGGLVAISASCTHVRAWEASIIGIIGGAVPIVFIRVLEAAEIDDPTGGISVHFFTGIWGMIALGLFLDQDVDPAFSNYQVGLFNGGGWYSIGVQCLAIICIIAWTGACTMLVYGLLKMSIGIRLSEADEHLGADYSEHDLKPLYVTHRDMRLHFPERWNAPHVGGDEEGRIGFEDTPPKSPLPEDEKPRYTKNGGHQNKAYDRRDSATERV